jgi:hypothetical protein
LDLYLEADGLMSQPQKNYFKHPGEGNRVGDGYYLALLKSFVVA